jgi:signal transduction histidine kinase
MSVQAVVLDPTIKNQLKVQIDETITEVRRISANLMPSVLKDFGVGAAIHNLVKDLQSHDQFKISYNDSTSQPSAISEDINIALYRIAQEALNNTIKYASATEVKISVTEFEDRVSLYIHDNGAGFDTENQTSGHGLRNMKMRTRLLNGLIFIESSENGTIIEVEIPLAS